MWYVANAGPRTARRFLRELRSVMQRLAAAPRRGRIVLTARAELVGLRCWAMRGLPFLVFYRAVVGGIEVVHVFHGARDRSGITE